MAKWIFDRPGTWEYPTFGIRASTGDVLDAPAAPDAYWSATDPAAVETVVHIHEPWEVPSFSEPADGTPIVYDTDTHSYAVGAQTVPDMVADALAGDAAITDAAIQAVNENAAFRLTGSGQPNGVVSAPVGSEYVDTAGTAGARTWFKDSGSGNTGWIVLLGDTGERNIDLDPAATTITNLITNPSFETGTQGWLPAGAGGFVGAVDGSIAKYGASNLKVSPTADQPAGSSPPFLTSEAIPVADPSGLYSGSAWVKRRTIEAPDEVRMLLLCYGASGYLGPANPSVFIPTTGADWNQASFEGAPLQAGTTSIKLAFYTNNVSTWGADAGMSIDGVQLTKTATLPPYFDGDTANDTDFDYSWTGAPGASASVRVRKNIARLRRVGSMVHFYAQFTCPKDMPSPLIVYTYPAGFGPSIGHYGPNTYSGRQVVYGYGTGINLFNGSPEAIERIHATWTTKDDWPATLPGTLG